MARRLTFDEEQRYIDNSPPVVAAPFSIHTKFRIPSPTNADRVLWALGDSSVVDQYWRLRARDITTNNGIIQWQARATTTASAESGINGYVADVWNAVTAVEAAADDRRLYVNGGEFTNTDSRAPAGSDRMVIGADADSSPFGFKSDQAYVAVWGRALSRAEAETLNNGGHPLQIRGLVAYYDMSGPDAPTTEFCLIRGTGLTIVDGGLDIEVLEQPPNCVGKRANQRNTT